MISGIGVDIIEIARIRSVHEQHGERFLQRIFTEAEREYCFNFADPYPHLAARFAAKEAVSKALGTGIGTHLRWRDIEVRNHNSGQPYVLLSERAERMLRTVGASAVLISLSHSRDYAVAAAVLVATHEERSAVL